MGHQDRRSGITGGSTKDSPYHPSSSCLLSTHWDTSFTVSPSSTSCSSCTLATRSRSSHCTRMTSSSSATPRLATHSLLERSCSF
uniref:Uncharacterized protein n=1 Tax=Aegilops tauschii subsp. strangulata TaxID=200361 RepID=A0A453N2A4_AEGTS